MADSKIWLSPPHMGGREIEYIQEAFESNWITSMGANLDCFEADLEDYLGRGYVTLLNSGTAAIHLGLVLLGVRAGDEVICQSFTFTASANPICYLGAKPVFVDSEILTWNICPIALEEAITDRIAKGKKPKVIIAVHMYGVPYQVERIRAVANQYEIPILEDSAEALGSKYKGDACGTLGDIGVFSFNGSKIITTSGGGAIITKTRELKGKALFLATQAKENLPFYEHKEIGYNYRMSNIAAGIGRGQMLVLEEHIDLRRKVNAFYIDLFKDVSCVRVYTTTDAAIFTNCWLTTILIEPNNEFGINNESLRQILEANHIESRLMWKPMHLQSVFEKYPYYGGTVAENLFKNGLCLPSGSNLTAIDKQKITTVINTVFKVKKEY